MAIKFSFVSTNIYRLLQSVSLSKLQFILRIVTHYSLWKMDEKTLFPMKHTKTVFFAVVICYTPKPEHLQNFKCSKDFPIHTFILRTNITEICGGLTCQSFCLISSARSQITRHKNVYSNTFYARPDHNISEGSDS